MRYYKTTITIYSAFKGSDVELSDLAREAEQGEAYCSEQRTDTVWRDELPEGARSFFFHDEEVT